MITNEYLKKKILFILYSAVGTGVDVALLNALVYCKMNKSIANFISYTVGILVAFFLCRKFAFKLNDNLGRRLVSTIVVHLIGFGVQQALFYILVESVGMDLNVAKIVTIVENAILMYILVPNIVFREYKSKKSKASKVGEISQIQYGVLFSKI